MIRKVLTIGLPLLLLVVMPSFAQSGSRDVGAEYRPVNPQNEMITVYIELMELTADGGQITADPILWYEGQEAEQVFTKYEPDAGIDGPPDGYYIINEDGELASYPLAHDAEVRMQIYDRTGNAEDIDISWDEQISLEKFRALFDHTDGLDVRDFPYHLTIEDGQITRIVQQYVP